MYPYRIRLRGPWECEPLAQHGTFAEGTLPGPCRMTMPCRWRDGGLGDFAGRVRFRRRFGLPRQIDAHERLFLTFDGVADRAEVWLNGQLLGRHEGAREPFEFAVTDLLRPRNDLVLEVEAAGGDGGLWGEVALEIRCTAFLRGLQLQIEDEGRQLTVSGTVVGTADRPLDLYVLLEGATVAYTTVDAAPDGWPFRLMSAEPLARARPDEVRIELVNGGVVWHGATVAAPRTN